MKSSGCSAIILIVVISNLHLNAQRSTKKPARLKATRDPMTCPDDCALKRRIGKVELRFEGDVSEIKASCLQEIDAIRSQFLDRNISRVHLTTQSETKENVDGKISRAVAQFKFVISKQQTKLENALSQVEKLSALPSLEEDLYESSQRQVELSNTINVMNQTLMILQQQNINLQQQTQAIRSQNTVLRASNDELSEENRQLMAVVRSMKSNSRDGLRITDAEENILKQMAKLNALQGQFDWLSDQLNVISDKMDEVALEAAKAAETAGRAETLSNKAISVARRQPTNSDRKEQLVPKNLPQPDEPPSDCWELFEMGYNISGIYRVRPYRSRETFQVYCEQSYNGGGWTLIQKRRDGSVDFNRNWQAYADGFGDVDGEMYLGNDKIFYLTNQDVYRLQVILLDWEGHRAYAEYEGFRVHSNNDYYSAQLGQYTRGTAGDAFRGAVDDGSRNAHLARFTTTDVDNDNCRPCFVDRDEFENCADLEGGGWWFRACSDSNLNGRYIQPQDFPACGDGCYGITWRTWRNDPNYSLKATIMMIKPLAATEES
uniref:angiopoietin-related protein 7-like n=1 Tax=Styela clava TaxID=7725 RepID=UPI00193A04C4|nr:angiopoietin-related protein 7-like [Styela clava]